MIDLIYTWKKIIDLIQTSVVAVTLHGDYTAKRKDVIYGKY